MEPLVISDKTIFLEGFSLKGGFQLKNINTKLAITFEIIEADKSDKEEILDIFPRKAIIFPHELQNISIRAKKQLKDLEVLEDESGITRQIKIRQDFDNQYNSIVSEKTNLERQSFKTQKFEEELYVQVSAANLGIIQALSEQAAFEHKLLNSISLIETPKERSIFMQNKHQIGDLVESLSINSKISAKKEQKQQISTESPNIREEQEHKQMYSVMSSFSEFSDQSFTSIKQKKSNMLYSNILSSGQQTNKMNFGQILILTIISALCFCLGSNLKSILNI